MKKKLVLIIGIISSLLIVPIFFSLFFLFLSIIAGDIKDEFLESVSSPNGKYRIDVYRTNCGATCSFGILGELCDTKNKCKEIYRGYKEYNSYVYWIDNENIFINNKTLNVFKDKYDYRDDKDYYKKRYIKKENNE